MTVEKLIKTISQMNTTELYKTSSIYIDDPLVQHLIDNELKERGDF